MNEPMNDQAELRRLRRALNSTKNGNPTAAALRAAERLFAYLHGEPLQHRIVRIIREDEAKRSA